MVSCERMRGVFMCVFVCACVPMVATLLHSLNLVVDRNVRANLAQLVAPSLMTSPQCGLTSSRYRCSEKGQAELICTKLREAFAAANRFDELRNGQPFMPMASLSSEIDSPLTAIEFDRGQIVPVRPIGAGLVGLVFLVEFTEVSGCGGAGVGVGWTRV